MTPTDRELLEAAAEAASVEGFWVEAGLNIRSNAEPLIWNPLTSDADALALLAMLRLDLDYRPGFVGVHDSTGRYIGQCPHDDGRPFDSAATRRAIVRAAYELSKGME